MVDRVQAQNDAQEIAAFVADVRARIADGFGYEDAVGLIAVLIGKADIFQRIAKGSDDDKVLYGEELFDAFTGTDQFSLLVDKIPYLEAGEEEQLFDLMKSVLGGVIRKQIAAGDAVA